MTAQTGASTRRSAFLPGAPNVLEKRPQRHSVRGGERHEGRYRRVPGPDLDQQTRAHRSTWTTAPSLFTEVDDRDAVASAQLVESAGQRVGDGATARELGLDDAPLEFLTFVRGYVQAELLRLG
jgi:hypothetical protein